jgi:excisionase family DNA binding protein
MSNENDGLTTKQVADIFHVTIRAVQLWAKKGLIQVTRTPGGHRRIAREELPKIRSYLNQQNHLVESSGSINHEQSLQYLKILLVEDDEYMLSLYENVITSWQYPPVSVNTANDGYQALVEVGKTLFDLIITDIKMPNIDGAKMINIIKQNNHHDMAKIVVVTSLSPLEISEQYKLPTDVDVYEKPVSYAQLQRLAIDIYEHKYLSVKASKVEKM